MAGDKWLLFTSPFSLVFSPSFKVGVNLQNFRVFKLSAVYEKHAKGAIVEHVRSLRPEPGAFEFKFAHLKCMLSQ